MATASSPDLLPSMPKMRKEPKPVGNLAAATTRALLDFAACFLRGMAKTNYSRVRKIGLTARGRGNRLRQAPRYAFRHAAQTRTERGRNARVPLHPCLLWLT